jgi:hypothetical protein
MLKFGKNNIMPLLKSLILFSLAFGLFSCGKNAEKEVEIPAGILSQEQFTKVLADFALAESAANMNIKNVVVQKTDSVYAFDPLLENNVRKSQYDSSVLFYTARPELYKKVYEQVLEMLSELQAKRNGTSVDSLSTAVRQ